MADDRYDHDYAPDDEQDRAPRRRTAAPWIKWTIGLTSRPEVLQIAAAINRSRREAAAMCMEVWEWCDANIDDSGYAPGVTKSFLDEHVSVTGFADAMERAGWLRSDSEGLIFPGYGIHNGNNAKKRGQAQKRMQIMRRR